MSSNQLRFTTEALKHSSVDEVYQLMNEDWAVFKQEQQNFARELIGLYFKLHPTQKSVRFTDLFRKRYGRGYAMDRDLTKAATLINTHFGAGAFQRFEHAVDQLPMQFFNQLFVRQAQKTYGHDEAPVALEKKGAHKLCITQNTAGDYLLKVKLSYAKICFPVNEALEDVDFNCTLWADFKLLDGGCQLEGLRVRSDNIGMMKKWILGTHVRPSIMAV